MANVPGEPDAEPGEVEPAPSTNFDGEDFLFHLYRGSELLQDNCVAEAKEELEAALAMQPRDVEGQALLGVVYFRLGHYPRAISIYEDVVRSYPNEAAPKINLALCYLKTGQYGEARAMLESVITADAEHRRAWGYLGLVFERLGDYAKARAAFERAEQPRLARRMEHLLQETTSTAHESSPPERAAVQAAAADAVEELNADEGPQPFSLAGDDSVDGPPSRSGRWKAIELGEERLPPPARPLRARALSYAGQGDHEAPPASELQAPTSVRGSVPAPATGLQVPPSPTQLAHEALLIFPDDPPVAMHADGVVLVHVEEWFATRVDALRAMSSAGKLLTSRPIHRRARGRDLDEPLGGIATPIVAIEGSGHLVLGAREDRRVVAVSIEEEFLYLREDHLVGFEHTVTFENGRLPLGEGEFVPMMQLAGRGTVVVESRRLIESIEVSVERPTVVRGEHVLGWTGRLIPRALAGSEAPGGARGFVAFSGNGAIFVDAS